MPEKDARKQAKLTPEMKAKQWKPGQSGNPKGRPPKVRCIPDILGKIGEEEGTVDGKYTKLEVVMRKVYEYALKGKPWAVQFLADRTEGRALERIEQKISNDEMVVLGTNGEREEVKDG